MLRLACAAGRRSSPGSLLLTADADASRPSLVPRAVRNAAFAAKACGISRRDVAFAVTPKDSTQPAVPNLSAKP